MQTKNRCIHTATAVMVSIELVIIIFMMGVVLPVGINLLSQSTQGDFTEMVKACIAGLVCVASSLAVPLLGGLLLWEARAEAQRRSAHI